MTVAEPIWTDPRLDSWNVEESDYPAGRPDAEKMLFLLRYAMLAPSSHNTQPWRFRIRDGAAELFADRGRRLPVVDPDGRELTISCGAALFFLRLAVRHFGRQAVVEPFPDREELDLLARVRLGPPQPPAPDEEILFEAIPKRRTNRGPFGTKRPPGWLLSALGEVAADEGAWLRRVEGEELRHAVAALVSEGDRLQLADREFRTELAHWLHPNRSHTRDGIPGYALGFGNLASYMGPLVVRTFDTGRGQAARDRHLAEGSPVLAVLGTDEDTVPAWLQAGQALARVLLRARSENVWAAFLNQPVEVTELRPRLAALLGGGWPQLLLRMGYGAEPVPTPRRPLSEVMIPED